MILYQYVVNIPFILFFGVLEGGAYQGMVGIWYYGKVWMPYQISRFLGGTGFLPFYTCKVTVIIVNW